MKQFTDQLGREVEIPSPPKRIISIVPSQTELLFDLGLDEEVVGITKFCVHPESWFRNKTRVGGTKALNLEKIRALKPDLIIANKEENEQSQVDELAAEFPVWISDIQNLDEALAMISSVSEICGKHEAGTELISQIKDGFDGLKPAKTSSAVYLIWNEPMMTADSDTFISDMMQRAGFNNLMQDSRYPELTLEQLQELNPEFLLLSSEPFPFKENHQVELQAKLPNTKVLLIDGEMFSWYGSRMRLALGYFVKLLA